MTSAAVEALGKEPYSFSKLKRATPIYFAELVAVVRSAFESDLRIDGFKYRYANAARATITLPTIQPLCVDFGWYLKGSDLGRGDGSSEFMGFWMWRRETPVPLRRTGEMDSLGFC